MRKKHVSALILKPGPTESGIPTPAPRPSLPEQPVGGELLPNALPAFLSQYWILIILLLIPLVFLFYKKRSSLLPWVLRLLAR